jgi:signal transduction histidine kinase
MRNRSGLITKINRAFFLQALLISIAVMLSVFFAKIVLEEVLIKQAIKQEADYFWQNYSKDASFPLPDTLNLTGYLNTEDLPEVLLKRVPEDTGFHEYEDDTNHFVVYLSDIDNRRLYLVYNRGQVDSLAAYYGIFPLALVLIVLYLSLWFTYRFSRRAISPISQLARHINEIDFSSINFSSADFSLLQDYKLLLAPDDDIQVLYDAIIHLGERLESFITRERNFTRDASHELRSPLTVINIAADMLLSEQALSVSALKTVDRIKRAVSDMEELTEAFLLLARESDRGLSQDKVCINDVIQEEIDRAQLLIQDKDLAISFSAENRLYAIASDKVVSVIVGNLLRNAILYTDEGAVDIKIISNKVIISDSGKGIHEQQVNDLFKPYYRGSNNNAHGYGVGMTIVKRLTDRFNWPIRIDSTPGLGTSIEVQFSGPGSESL